MVISNSYVSLPEGNIDGYITSWYLSIYIYIYDDIRPGYIYIYMMMVYITGWWVVLNGDR